MKTLARVFACLALTLTFTWSGLSSGIAMAQAPQFTAEFRLEDCRFKTTGANPCLILRPGYRKVFEGTDGGETVRLVITVLRQTETVSLPGIGVVRARVVEERETVGGELVEVSRNLFAICDKTNDVFYFGEAVDIFNPDGTVTHEGSWRAGGAPRHGAAQAGGVLPRALPLGAGDVQER